MSNIFGDLKFENKVGEEFLLAPTGALIVMMVYYISGSGSGSNFFRFSLGPVLDRFARITLFNIHVGAYLCSQPFLQSTDSAALIIGCFQLWICQYNPKKSIGPMDPSGD